MTNSIKKIDRVALAGNYRTLLIELMMLPKEGTLFFVQDTENSKIEEALTEQGYSCICYHRFRRKNQLINLLAYYKQDLSIKDKLRKCLGERQKTVTVYGADHIYALSKHFKDNGINVIEEGFSNYVEKNELYRQNGNEPVNLKRIIKLGILLQLSMLHYQPYGYDEKVDRIYLTGLEKVPAPLKEKMMPISLQELWNACDNKSDINAVFEFDPELYSDKVILLTQPFSEDGACTEAEKIAMYRHICEKEEAIIIKPHPRDETDYKKAIEGPYVDSGSFPFELLVLNRVKLKKVITIASTSALACNGICDIEFLGTVDYPMLQDRFGVVEKRIIKRGEL